MDRRVPRGTQQFASLIIFLKNLKIIMNKELVGAQRVHIRQVNFTALYSYIVTAALTV